MCRMRPYAGGNRGMGHLLGRATSCCDVGFASASTAQTLIRINNSFLVKAPLNLGERTFTAQVDSDDLLPLVPMPTPVSWKS